MYKIADEDIVKLLAWYRKKGRHFPWRNTGNPYDVWISEIMLQQTRTEAVISYFLRFKEEFPDVKALANADEERLMRLWEGLGYYSRARNLKKCAARLMEEYEGKIPEDYKTLLSLPGIGPYTAGAILSIAYGRPYPAVDGNVLRVFSRYLGIKEDIRLDPVRKKMEEVILAFYEDHKDFSKEDVSAFCQALMDLGAMICLPKGKTVCEDCPLNKNCYAFSNDRIDQLPYRSKNKERKIVDRTLFILRDGERFLLSRRKQSGLLALMYEFIGVDKKLSKDEAKQFLNQRGFEVLRMKSLPSSKHIFSHLEWHMDAYEVFIGDWHLPLKENEVLVTREELDKMALPSAFKTYIDYYALRKS